MPSTGIVAPTNLQSVIQAVRNLERAVEYLTKKLDELNARIATLESKP